MSVTTGPPIATHEETSPRDVDTIFERAHDAAARWRQTPPAGL